MGKECEFVQRFNIEDPPTEEECKRHCCCLISGVEFLLWCLKREPWFNERFGDCVTEYDVMIKCTDYLRGNLSPDYPNLLTYITHIYHHVKVLDKRGKPVDTMYNNLVWCLDHKVNLSDCIYGCCSLFMCKDLRDSCNKLRNSHQWRVPEDALRYMVKKVSEKWEEIKEATKLNGGNCIIHNFDEVLGIVRDLKIFGNVKSKGYGQLAMYDTSLRLVWHTERRDDLLPEAVYIYQGPLWAVTALWKIGKMIHHEFLPGYSKPPKYGAKLTKEHYPSEFRDVEYYQLENLLCIFHVVFQIWEIILAEKISGAPVQCEDKIRKEINKLKNKKIK